MKLNEGFYQQTHVVKIARELLGKVLVTRLKNKTTSGMIVETEAYSRKERGCHAFGNRMTKRNEVMFKSGGYAYVYLCYGIHNLFNIVTNEPGVADAILIRALEPLEGVDVMMKRMNAPSQNRITSGPGKLTKALGIDRSLNGAWLMDNKVWVEDVGHKIKKADILARERIGIDYAGEDAKLPWRFIIHGNRWVSKV